MYQYFESNLGQENICLAVCSFCGELPLFSPHSSTLAQWQPGGSVRIRFVKRDWGAKLWQITVVCIPTNQRQTKFAYKCIHIFLKRQNFLLYNKLILSYLILLWDTTSAQIQKLLSVSNCCVCTCTYYEKPFMVLLWFKPATQKKCNNIIVFCL